MPVNSDAFIGEIMLFAGTFAPQGWLQCNGQLVAISAFESLFNLIGTTYGGDGVNTFAVPDLRGRCVIGAGQAFGFSPRSIGESAGSTTVTLLAAQIPSHTHTVLAANAAGNAPTPEQRLPAIAEANAKVYAAAVGGLVDLGAAAVSSAGGSQPHRNMQPSLALIYCIRAEGIFPSQS